MRNALSARLLLIGESQMKSEGDKGREASKAQRIEWHVCEDEREWQTAQVHSTEDRLSAAQPRQRTFHRALRWGAPALIFLLVLASAGGLWLWSIAQAGLDQIETELQAVVAAEMWIGTDPAAPGATPSMSTWQEQGERLAQVEIRDLGADWAVVEVHVQPAEDERTYRQTRVYYQSQRGWVRGDVAVERWGSLRTLQTKYFTVSYSMLDREAVTQSASRLDDLYEAIYASFFTDKPMGKTVLIMVDPEWTPGESPNTTMPPDALVVASPSATLAPAELAPGDQFLQSVMLALFDRLAQQARSQYGLPSQWIALRNGLQLWIIWEQNLPLATWRTPLVRWYFGATKGGGQMGFNVPEFAHNLCAYHNLWMPSPSVIGVPILCWQEPGGKEQIIAWRSPVPFPQMSLPAPLNEQAPLQDVSSWRTQQPSRSVEAAVALATVIEYATTTFGTERLPLLLSALPEHESWETLAPTVFGLSQEEFEHGWCAFVEMRYDLKP